MPLTLLAPPWILLLTGLGAVGTIGLTALTRRGGRRLPELLLAGGLVGLWVMGARPASLQEVERQVPGRVAVLVDDSRSMTLRGPGDRPWSDRVGEVLGTLGPDVEVYHFGGDLAAGPAAGWEQRDSDLGAALSSFAARSAGRPYAGVVLISDGLDRGALRRGWQRDGALQWGPLPGPLTIYAAGAPSAGGDLAVGALTLPSVAYAGEPLPVRARIRGGGFEGREVPVQLLSEEGVVDEGTVSIGPEGWGEVTLEATPRQVGPAVLWVQVPDLRGDASPLDNRAPAVVQVVRDRLRVLHVAGAPSWDVKFLRRFLKEDPSVEMVSFFILRTTADMSAGYGGSELALIPFPYRELLSDELPGFDVVILQDFDQQPYLQGDAEVLGQLRDFVTEQGGGLVMVGGPQAFRAGGYAGTAVEGVLPVALGRGAPWVDEEVVPSLTPAGRLHPITRLEPTEDQSAQGWARLPALEGLNLVQGLAPGAVALLDDAAGRPVVAVREVGAGRTMALLSDESWRYAFAEAGEGRGNQAYLRLWKGALRWLARDPQSQAVLAQVDDTSGAVGVPVSLQVIARGPGFRPAPGARVEVAVQRDGLPVDRLAGLTGEDGVALLSWTPAEAGSYRLQVLARQGDTSLGSAEAAVAVSAEDPELRERSPDLAFLQALAASGRYYPPESLGPPRLDQGQVWVEREERLTDLSAHPLLVGATLLLLGLGWLAGRREARP
ncbi:MAG: hypothetical protein JXX28_19240 [Deltaproteobacteria bacterium]|nr:hypothetical protein [Deltaproteobacteria bacterium]